jgi:hypothetical protein
MRFPLATFLRRGCNILVPLSLPFAVLGVGAALLWVPNATGEELVLVVGLPLVLFTLGLRIWMAVKPQPAPRDDRAAAKALAKAFRAVPALLVLLIALMLILLGFSTLTAVPIYLALGIDWAPGFGVLGAALLVLFGVGAFILAMVMFSPRLFLVMLRSSGKRVSAPFATIRGLFVSSH